MQFLRKKYPLLLLGMLLVAVGGSYLFLFSEKGDANNYTSVPPAPELITVLTAPQAKSKISTRVDLIPEPAVYNYTMITAHDNEEEERTVPQLAYRIKNAGVNSMDEKICVYIAVYKTGSEKPVYTKRKSIVSLGAGQTSKFFVEDLRKVMTSTSEISRVEITVDPKSLIAETNETNNLFSTGKISEIK